MKKKKNESRVFVAWELEAHGGLLHYKTEIIHFSLVDTEIGKSEICKI